MCELLLHHEVVLYLRIVEKGATHHHSTLFTVLHHAYDVLYVRLKSKRNLKKTQHPMNRSSQPARLQLDVFEGM